MLLYDRNKFQISALDQLEIGNGEGQVSSFAISDFFIAEHNGKTYAVSPYDIAKDVLSNHLDFAVSRQGAKSNNVLSVMYKYVDEQNEVQRQLIKKISLQDGILSDVQFNDADNTLSLYFNSTEPGNDPIVVSLSSLADTYTVESPLCANTASGDGHTFGIDISALSSALDLSAIVAENRRNTDLIYYVLSSGDDITGDGSEDHPFRTIQKAVNESNKWRFTGNATCRIRLLSEITGRTIISEDGVFIWPEQWKIYHPDMVQGRSFIIEGYELSGDSGYRVMRRLQINQSNKDTGHTYTRKPYSVAINCEANVTFIGIYFYGLYDYSDDNDPASIGTISYMVRAGNNVVCEFNTCFFWCCHTAIVTGSCSVVNMRKCAFHTVCRGIDSLDTSSVEISHDTTAKIVKIFALAANRGSIRVNFNYPSFFYLGTTDYPFSINDSGSILLTLKNGDNAVSPDYAFLTYKWVRSGPGGGYYTYVQEYTGNLQNYLTYLTNDSTRTDVGYNLNGYMNIYTTDSAFLSNMTSHTKRDDYMQNHDMILILQNRMSSGDHSIEDIIVK